MLQVINTKNQLERAVSMLNVDTSVAVCFLHGGLDTHSIVALRNAGRLCDYVFAVNLSSEEFPPSALNILEKAGVNALYQNKGEVFSCMLDAGVKGLNATLILQTLQIIMPLSVTVAENNVNLIRILKNIQETFGCFFNLEVKTMPAHLLSSGQRRLRELLLPVLLNMESGETDVNKLSIQVGSLLKASNVALKSFSFVDVDTLRECKNYISPTALLLVEARIAGQNVRDVLSLTQE